MYPSSYPLVLSLWLLKSLAFSNSNNCNVCIKLMRAEGFSWKNVNYILSKRRAGKDYINEDYLSGSFDDNDKGGVKTVNHSIECDIEYKIRLVTSLNTISSFGHKSDTSEIGIGVDVCNMFLYDYNQIATFAVSNHECNATLNRLIDKIVPPYEKSEYPKEAEKSELVEFPGSLTPKVYQKMPFDTLDRQSFIVTAVTPTPSNVYSYVYSYMVYPNTSWPTSKPTGTSDPTEDPTRRPTPKPTSLPTRSPRSAPTLKPTKKPTVLPTVSPSTTPTVSPTCVPTPQPSGRPSLVPTAVPSPNPTTSPTLKPSFHPTPNFWPVMSFDATLTWSGLRLPSSFLSFPYSTGNNLDEITRKMFISAAAHCMNVSSEYVSIRNVAQYRKSQSTRSMSTSSTTSPILPSLRPSEFESLSRTSSFSSSSVKKVFTDVTLSISLSLVPYKMVISSMPTPTPQSLRSPNMLSPYRTALLSSTLEDKSAVYMFNDHPTTAADLYGTLSAQLATAVADGTMSQSLLYYAASLGVTSVTFSVDVLNNSTSNNVNSNSEFACKGVTLSIMKIYSGTALVRPSPAPSYLASQKPTNSTKVVKSKETSTSNVYTVPTNLVASVVAAIVFILVFLVCITARQKIYEFLEAIGCGYYFSSKDEDSDYGDKDEEIAETEMVGERIGKAVEVEAEQEGYDDDLMTDYFALSIRSPKVVPLPHPQNE